MNTPITIHVRDWEYVTSGRFEPEESHLVDADLTFDAAGERVLEKRIVWIRDANGLSVGRSIGSVEDARLFAQLVEDDGVKALLMQEQANRIVARTLALVTEAA